MNKSRKIISLLLSLIMLFSIASGFAIQSFAEEQTDDVLAAQMLDALGDTIYIFEDEVDFAGCDDIEQSEIIYFSIIDMLEGLGFDVAEANQLNIDVFYGAQGFETADPFEYFHSADIRIGNHGRRIDLKFSNTDNYNTADEEYVNNLKFDKNKLIYEEIAFYNEYDSVIYGPCESVCYYYENLIDDDSVQVVLVDGFNNSGINYFSNSDNYLQIFKNGVFYRLVPIGKILTVPVIEIPLDMPDENVHNYIIQTIQKRYQDVISVGELVPGFVNADNLLGENYKYDIDYPDGYTFNASVYSSEEGVCEFDNYIVIRRAEAPQKQIIVDKSDSVYVIGSGKDVKIYCTYRIDGFAIADESASKLIIVNESDYFYNSDLTVLTLKSSFLDTLDVAEYTVPIFYEFEGEYCSERMTLKVVSPAVEKPTQSGGETPAEPTRENTADTVNTNTTTTAPSTEKTTSNVNKGAKSPSTGYDVLAAVTFMIAVVSGLGSVVCFVSSRKKCEE